MSNQDIHYLLKRGVAEIIVEEEMSALLRSGKKLRLKEGFDPSFPDIHLGHMVALRKLRQFQEQSVRYVRSMFGVTVLFGRRELCAQRIHHLYHPG